MRSKRRRKGSEKGREKERKRVTVNNPNILSQNIRVVLRNSENYASTATCQMLCTCQNFLIGRAHSRKALEVHMSSEMDAEVHLEVLEALGGPGGPPKVRSKKKI
jgi:hypothetical protein